MPAPRSPPRRSSWLQVRVARSIDRDSALIKKWPKTWVWEFARKMWYCADVGPSIGVLMFDDSVRRINVLEQVDETQTIGTASRLGSDRAGLALWRLKVRGADLSGRWIVIDRQFVPAE